MGNENILSTVEVVEVSDNNKTSFTLSYGDRVFEATRVTKLLVDLTKQNLPDEIIAEKVSSQLKQQVSATEIDNIRNRLIQSLTATQGSQLDTIKFKIPIISPAWVERLTRPLVIFYNKPVLLAIEILFGISVLFTAPSFFNRRFLQHLSGSFDAELFLLANIIILAIVLFHELGHATACRKFGIRNGAIGFGIYFITPVFYSDTTQAWNLHSRKRLLIDFGGIYFQTIILIPLSYYFNRTGSLLAGYLIFLNYIIILSNLNPLLKYDGYWIVTDMFNIPNVRQKTSLLLTNSLKAIFIPKRKHGANLLEGLNTRSRIFLISYTVLANIFFIYFFGFLLPKVMVAVSGQIIKDLRLISAMPVLTQWPGYRQFFSLLFTLLLKSLILLSLVRVVYTLFKKIISFVKSLIYDWNIE